MIKSRWVLRIVAYNMLLQIVSAWLKEACQEVMTSQR